MPNDFRAAPAGRILVADGAMGTRSQAADLSVEADFQGLEGCNEILDVARPDVVRAVREAYLAAGSDCIETNTFGANLGNLGDYHIHHRIRELSEAGAELSDILVDCLTFPIAAGQEETRRDGRIAVMLSEEFQLEPEQSTDAIIAHHPEATYFTAR